MEDVSLLKQGPKRDVRTHPLLGGATRAACNGEGKAMSLGFEGWVLLEEGVDVRELVAIFYLSGHSQIPKGLF